MPRTPHVLELACVFESNWLILFSAAGSPRKESE